MSSERGLLRQACGFARGGAANLLAAALAVLAHLGVLSTVANRAFTPQPARPAPQLLVDSLELTLAEVESEEHIAPVLSDRPATPVSVPQPDLAPYLFDATAPIALSEPPPPRPSPLPPPPGLLIPEAIALPDCPPADNPLPEISLPPAEVPPPSPECQTPHQATGATARLEDPRMVTDLSRLVKSYPPEARRNHWEGTVVLALEIGPEGTLRSAEIHRSSGHGVLDRAALKMIRSARFTGGPGRLLQPIDYKLK